MKTKGFDKKFKIIYRMFSAIANSRARQRINSRSGRKKISRENARVILDYFDNFFYKFIIIFRMFAVYPPIAASEARFLAANSRGNKKNRAAVETYDCKHCNRSFNKQYNLLIHERSHEKSENQTLFNCNICGKGFRSMNNMKNHR